MPIKAAVANLIVFRRSIRPHSAVAFMVEYLCFILELLREDKDLAKLFGIICACDTFIITLVDVISKLKESSLNSEGRKPIPNWLPCPDCWRNFDVYLILLSMLHVAGSIVSYMFHSPYLVLIPLVLAALELVPENSYKVFKVFQDDHPRSTSEVQSTMQASTHAIEAQMATLRDISTGEFGESSEYHSVVREIDTEDRMPYLINLLLSQHQGLDHIQDGIQNIISQVTTLRGSIVDAYLMTTGESIAL